MNCKKCNAELHEGDLFCPECMDKFAVNEQKEKVAEVSKVAKNTVLKQLNNIMFLVMAICFSVMVLPTVISTFTGLPMSILTNALELIFSIITVVGLWMGYTAKETSDLNKILRRASIYDAYTSVMYTIAIVFLAIGAAAATILSFLGGSLFSGASSSLGGNSQAQVEGDAIIGGIISAIVVILVFGVIIAIVSIMKSIYKSRRKYFVALGASTVSGEYKVEKAPIVGSFVLGGLSILSAIPSFLFGILKEIFLTPVLTNLGEFGLFIDGILNGMIGGMIFAALGSLVVGAYYILSGIWIKATHEAQLQNGAAVAAEQAALEKLEAETEAAIREVEMQKKKAEDDARAAADLEAKQTQAMMQQMMMQMMQQQQANNAATATATAAPAAEEAPSAE